ncbi:hypothetical protein BALOs_0296 [Halobacteriovorax sp. BALOs_7]|uniref:Uncharacterized protein n=1 Tax=Halobacteriovorax vibrionivorans TaxID=2152716 RepID=A0ABY0IHY8_9BACT|nr:MULTISPECIES: hypothetical protein [Halobacteriovorax]AYF43311.1 hypothetical protein BALOs_0296 [Halobacteriovorax sp. BALOs_7]RZF22114.1 hypothetical protein DAY19_10555 [Halobacteriovorax vibrionivorans]TGD46925.1 hypothetical protein EP118_09850 [Halobacteriovorax sp. Y22]
MQKKALILLFMLLTISNAFAIKLDIVWTENFEKEIHLECRDPGCLDGSSRGIIFESICDECFSDSINATFIFNDITTYLHRGELISTDEFINYLFEEEYITIQYDTPYDVVSSRSKEIKKLLFQNLCPNEYDAIIFFERGYGNIFSSPQLIYCGEEVYSALLF